MVTYKRTLRRALPVDGQQGVEVVLGGHSGQTVEDVPEVSQGIDAAVPGRRSSVNFTGLFSSALLACCCTPCANVVYFTP